MQTTVIHSIVVRGFHHVASESEAVRYKSEFRRVWEFRHESYGALHAFEVGRRLNQAGLLNAHGIGDAHCVEAARAALIAQQVLKDWNRRSDDGQPIPVTPESIATLPMEVLLAFGRAALRGYDISKDELDLLRAQ